MTDLVDDLKGAMLRAKRLQAAVGMSLDLSRPVEVVKVVDALLDKIDARWQEMFDEMRSALRLAELLSGVCDALKGEHPDPLTMYSWHDLPEVAAEIKGALEHVRAMAATSRTHFEITQYIAGVLDRRR